MSDHTDTTTPAHTSGEADGPQRTTGPVSPTALRDVVDELTALSAVECLEVRTDLTFADITTLHLGGRPYAVVDVTSPVAVGKVVKILDDARVPWLVMGGGSNMVVNDSPDVSKLMVLRLVAAPRVDLPLDPDEAPMSDLAPIMMDPPSGMVTAFGGVVWDSLVAATVSSGLGGLECLSGIPGTVGAVPVQNVGAYGVEVSSVMRRVLLTHCRALDGTQQAPSGSQEWVTPEDLELRYRYSNLKFTRRAVVTAVEFQLSPDGLSAPLRYGELSRVLEEYRQASEEALAQSQPAAIPAAAPATEADTRYPAGDVRRAVLALRRKKGMVLDPEDHDTWSVGSFFTNPILSETEAAAVRERVREERGDAIADSMPVFPGGDGQVKLSAAWLIDKSGLRKGWGVRPDARATLSTKHTLALTNRGNASPVDLIELASAVQNHVFTMFGVRLDAEPVMVGF